VNFKTHDCNGANRVKIKNCQKIPKKRKSHARGAVLKSGAGRVANPALYDKLGQRKLRARTRGKA